MYLFIEKKLMKKNLAENTFYYLIYNVLNVIFPFLTGIYVARVLLPADVGMVLYAQNIVQYFVILAFFGLPTYGLREIAKVKDEPLQRNKVFTELFIINAISTLTFSTIYVVMIFSVPSFSENILLYLIVGLSIAFNAIDIVWLYEGMEEFKFISVRSTIIKTLSFIALIIFVREPKDYLIYAIITVVGICGNHIISILCHGKLARFDFKGLNIKRHLKPVLFLVAVNLSIELYTLVDTTMLGIFCDEERVAFYSYGSKINKILLQVVNTFTMVIVPKLASSVKNGDKESFNNLLSKTLRIIIILALPMIIGLQFVAGTVIEILYTSTYSSSATVLRILSLVLLISPIGYLLGSRVCLVTGNEKKMLLSVSIGAIVNIIGNLLLIPKFQEYGAAMASVFSEIVVMVVYILLGKKYFTLNSITKNVVKTIIATVFILLALILLSILRVNYVFLMIVQIMSTIIMYFALLIMLKEEDVFDVWKKLTAKLMKKNS